MRTKRSQHAISSTWSLKQLNLNRICLKSPLSHTIMSIPHNTAMGLNNVMTYYLI